MVQAALALVQNSLALQEAGRERAKTNSTVLVELLERTSKLYGFNNVLRVAGHLPHASVKYFV